MQKQCFFLLFMLAIIGATWAQTTPKVLIVVSSYGKNEGKTRPGFEMDELAQAYLIFKANDIVVDIASPKGGAVEADKFDAEKPYNKDFLALPEANQLLQHTLQTAQVKADDYNAIYIVGGKGTVFDLPFDTDLQELVADIHAKGGLVSAVCHGSAAFAHVKKADGSYWAAGKKMTGFTNAEEVLFGKRWKAEFPFFLEDKLRARGAQFEQADVMLPNICTDQNLITGQNPYSTTLLAEAVVTALGLTPQTREQYPDEKTMLLVKDALQGRWVYAREELQKHQSQYDIPLLAIYGYYRYKSATDNPATLQKALDLMNFADEFFDKPELDIARADCYRILGDLPRTKQILESVLAKEPENSEAKQALEALKKK